MIARMRRLSSQILFAQVCILVVTVALGFLLFLLAFRATLDHQYEERAAAVAGSVAVVPDVRSCMAAHTATCDRHLLDLADAVAKSTGASYVVLIGMDRTRYTHPDRSQVGRQVEEPVTTMDGHVHLDTDQGSTGRSANGKAPLYGPDGQMVGEVSVGIQEQSVQADLGRELPSFEMWFVVALGAGVVASLVLASRLKRRTFGLELDEIVHMLQEREATLHGIREGVVGVDAAGRLTVVNDEAFRLLDVPANPRGRPVEEVFDGDLLRAVTAETTGKDEFVITDDRCLVVSARPVVLAGQAHGRVVTLRDHTELLGLQSELDGERGLMASLRAQQHEFANRLHAVAGLLQVGHTQEALEYLLEIRGSAAELDDTIRTHIGCPQVVGLLLGKAAQAGEAGVDLRVSPDSWLSEHPPSVHVLISVIGNLLDNAIDALAAVPAPRHIEVLVTEDDAALTVSVSDDGPGVRPEDADRVFADGYSTKGGQRGLGLAIIARMTGQLGGRITVAPTRTGVEGRPGARFVAVLPVRRAHTIGGAS